MLNLQLFGAFSAKDQFGREIYFRDNKVRALLAYLALEGSQTQPREKLLELFWGYASQERAQHSLRMALTRLRQSLEQAGLADLLHVTRSTVQLQPEPPRFWVDAVEFEELAAHCRGYGAADGASHALTRAWMRRAVELYRGRLLFGINLNDSPSFEYWLTLAQSRYEQQTLSFLAALAEHALTSQEIDLAEDYARRQLALLPGHERAHRQLMRVFAQRGQRQLVWQQYQQCVHELKAELGAEPEAETTALFEQLARGSSFPAASGADTPPDKAAGAPNNLPALFTPFFGRENERSRLIDLLLNPAAPLLTVVGPGGAGKTRLALDSVHHVLHFPAFRDGVWFVPLDGLRAGDQNLHQAMASTIAQALGLELSPQSPPHAQLLTQLKPRKTLLILDNFEQLIAGETDGVDFVLDLVRHLPSLKLLVSSRRPLNLQMETLIALNGLPAPQKADDSAYSYSSVQLFMERGRRVCPACSFEGDNLPAMVEICRILEGMPLALELVAVRLRELNCQQLLQALTTDLDLFKTRWRDLAPRHRSMRAVFDWSWSLLSQEEQRVLSELSLFRGSFTLEAAQAITGADSESVYALIDHSLIRFSEGRYSLHALLRQFAGDQLAAAAPIHRRHSRYYLDFVRQRAQRLIGQELVQASAEIGQEWENIQQAWLWAVSEHDLSGLASTLDGLGHYLRNSSMIWFGETLFQAALDSLLAAEDSACAGRAAAEADQRARSETGPSGSFQAGVWRGADESRQWQQTIGQLWLELARGYVWSAQYEHCAVVARQVIAIGHEIADPVLVAGGGLELGRALWRLGDYRAACDILHAMPPLSDQQAWIETQAMNTLGNIYFAQGLLDQAETHYHRALQIQQEAGIWGNRVQVLNNLATIAALRGQLEAAQGLFLEVLAASRQFNQQFFQIPVFLNLGLCSCALGQYVAGEAHLQQALALSNQIRNRQNETDILLGLAQLYRSLGNHAAGREYLQQALELCRQSGEKNVMAEALMQSALLHLVQGNLAEAHQASQESARLIQELGPTGIALDIAITSGYCCLALSDEAGAHAAFSAGLAISQAVGNPLKRIEAQAGLARIQLDRGELDAAAARLEELWQQIESQESLMGAVLPYELYWLIAQSLAELDDPRAQSLLSSAGALIQAQAEAIPDPLTRQDFVQQPICQRILAPRVAGNP